MKSQLLLIALLLGLSTPLYAALPEPQSQTEKIQTAYGQLPLSFEENQGQTDAHVKFLSRGQGYILFLTATEAVLTLQKKETADSRPAGNPLFNPLVLTMGLSGANRTPAILGEESLPGKQNYFLGNDPKKWRTDIPTFQKVKYQNVYPGIDLVYYGNRRELEYDFMIAPKADPRKIELGFKGADEIKIDAQGNLVLSIQGNKIQLRKPIIYQNQAGKREFIPGGYLLKGKEKVGFQVASYDRTKPLVIDPVLGYSTYLGGTNFDSGNAIAVDGSGDVYITGSTYSSDFPTTSNPFGGTAFVTKLNPAGNALMYSTYLGGNGNSVGSGIAVDAVGNVALIGWTVSKNFPTKNAVQATLNTSTCEDPDFRTNGCIDAFLTKLDATGSVLIYSTYLGGNEWDFANGVATDPPGNAYVVGQTRSYDFPTQNPLQATLASTRGCNVDPSREIFEGEHGGGTCYDVFIAKFSPTGSMIYSTYLGGIDNDIGNSIAIDPSGNAYITGSTGSPDFPTKSPIQSTFSGGTCTDFITSWSCPDVFITKINAAGTALIYSTYLGGNNVGANSDGAQATGGADIGRGISIDRPGNVYVTGQTGSFNFPITVGAFQTACKSTINFCGDAFITKIDPAGRALLYSTYLGGGAFDVGRGIQVDQLNNAYITGSTDSIDFPSLNAIQPTSGSNCTDRSGTQCTDVFVTKINPSGSALIYSTYLGGGDEDKGYGIAIDPLSNIYVAGVTTSANFPTTPGAFQTTYGNAPNLYSDAFVTKIAVTQSFSDAFNRANSTSLSSNWNEYLGNLEVFNGQVRNSTTNNKASIYTRTLGPDQSVSVDCKVSDAGNSCGVMARWSSESNFYRARIDVGAQNIALYKTVDGTTTRLGISTRPLAFNTFYRIRLVVRGASVSAYFANESTPAISVSDTSLPSGNFAGIRSYASSVYATVFENFDVTTPLADTFNRTNSTSLGASWNEYLPDLEIFGGEVRNVSGGGQPKAARYLASVGPDQEVAVDCKVTAAGNACGLMGRWSDANHYYLLRLDAGAQNVALFKVVNGATTRLGLFSRPLKFNTYYRLRLIVKGNRLIAFFGNEIAAAISVTDASLTTGSFAGIRSYASGADTTFFNNFDLTVAQ